jgi:hypothetical protein
MAMSIGMISFLPPSALGRTMDANDPSIPDLPLELGLIVEGLCYNIPTSTFVSFAEIQQYYLGEKTKPQIGLLSVEDGDEAMRWFRVIYNGGSVEIILIEEL